MNGTQVVNNWTDHSSTENSGTIALTAGTQYSITMEFYENGGDAVAKLSWSSASQAKQIIPSSRNSAIYPVSSSPTSTPSPTSTNTPVPTSTNTPTATSTPTPSTIAFRSAASNGVASGSLTINKPAGTVQNDVMIAAIAVRPETGTITPPSGWTLVNRYDNANANQNSLAIYYRVAGASEPANYNGRSQRRPARPGGIQSFSGVSTSNPIQASNGGNTPNGLNHAAPSVTTSVANEMLVSAHAFTSAASWTQPTGMTEAYEAASVAVPDIAGISIEGNYQKQAAAGASGTKTATASNDADVGNAAIVALRPGP